MEVEVPEVYFTTQGVSPPREVYYSQSTEFQVRMRVSSSHLSLASPHFRLRSDRCLSLSLEDWDADALLILMNVIHGQTRQIPRSISLEVLAKLAIILDYCDCVEVTEIVSEMWLNNLKENLPEIYSRDLILWIWVSWIFRQEETFKVATAIALKQSRGPNRHPRVVEHTDYQSYHYHHSRSVLPYTPLQDPCLVLGGRFWNRRGRTQYRHG